MRESSKAFQEVVREMYTTYEWTLLQTGKVTTSTQRASLAHWTRSDEMILALVQGEGTPTSGSGSEHRGH